MKYSFNLQSAKTILWSTTLFGLLMVESARAFLSIAMALLIGVYFYESIRFGKKNQFGKYIRALLVMATGFVVLYALQFYQSENIDALWVRIVIKLPFVILALAVIYAKPIQSSHYYLILKSFVLVVFCVSLLMFINYLFNIEAINTLYAQSSVMPGIINHIRFSIMLAFSVYITYYLLFGTTTFEPNSKTRKLFMFIFIFLILFVHLYSVRGGILALYTLAAYEFSRTVFTRANGKKYIGYSLLILFLLVVSLFTVPTIKNKLDITLLELQQYSDGKNLNHNSLGKRFASYEIAWDIFKQSPALGCGIGDYEMLNKQMFQQWFPEVEVPILAHNQFLYFLAASGLVGLLIFGLTFFYALLNTRVKYPRLFIAHLLVLFVSFQTEPMLETQLGVAYSALFWILPLCVVQRTENPDVTNQ